MREAVLNPLIESLDKESEVYKLYSSLLDMAEKANGVDAPDFVSNPPMKVDENGNQLYDPNDPVVPLVDTEEIDRKIKEYTEIQTKNYAYDLANAIVSSVGGSGGTGGVGGDYLPLSGGYLKGWFSAKHGVELGDQDKAILTIACNGDGVPVSSFASQVDITGDVTILDSQLNLDDKGIFFNKYQSIYVDQQTLTIDYQNVKIKGLASIDGPLTIGNVTIDGNNGISFQNNSYYHAGNSNKADVDWSTRDLHVYGDLIVDGKQQVKGRLQALHGFDLGESGTKYLYSSYDNNKAHIWLNTDLTVLGYDNGIKFDDYYVIRTRSTDHNVVSIGSPGRVLNLGDSDDDISGATDSNGNPLKVPTSSIALQTDFNTADNAVTLITAAGAGYFLGLSAKSVSAGDLVLQTYRTNSTDEGVLFHKKLTFANTEGPTLYSEDAKALYTQLPYTITDGSTPVTKRYYWSSRLIATDSLFKDQQLNTPTVEFTTDAQFFRFDKPTEAKFFSIISAKYKTSLEEGRLFLNDNGSDSLFLQAVSNSIFHSGNATFNHSLSSVAFTSGLSGYGWAILENALTGSYEATFDELTVRKKMRVYELEVQKQNITNGSWWVTDSCAGDLVEEV